MSRLLVILCVAVYLTLQCSSTPLSRFKRNEENDVQTLPEYSDGGPVDSCEIPVADVCNNTVNYSVPSSVAKIANVINALIGNIYEQALENTNYGEECAMALRDIHCAQNFPSCSEDEQTVTLSPAVDCAATLLVCPQNVRKDIMDSGLCDLETTTTPLADCKPVIDYNYDFQHCQEKPGWYVTDWMHELMKHADKQLVVRLSPGGIAASYGSDCNQPTADYQCQFMGRCWQNERVEIINTVQSCDPLLDCYPDWYADALKPNFPCEHWPSKFDAPDIPPEMTQATTEEATTQTIIQETTEPSTQPTWPSASTYSSTRDETPSTIGNAATSNSLSLGGLLVLTSLTAVTLLHHL